MKVQFEKFLNQIQKAENRAIKQAEKTRFPKFFEFSYSDDPPKMVAIDGSNRWIWYNTDMNARIAIIRASAVVYEYNSKYESKLNLVDHDFKDIPVLIAPNNADMLNYDPEVKSLHQDIKKALGRRPTARGILNQLRELEEYKFAEEMALKYDHSLIVMDGALTIIQVKQIEDAAKNLREACIDNQNTLIGVSKRNTTRRLRSNLTDEAVVKRLTQNDPRMVYTEVRDIPKGKQVYPPLGLTFLAKLHTKPVKTFRVDIVPQKEEKIRTIFSYLANYSIVDSFLGYPFPLVDAHNIAALLRRVPEMYNHELVDAGTGLGIEEEEIFKYLISHENIERDPFHRHLDEVTR
ncbi:MAG: DNA double-strand break repair nuclease NurA [Candidatus Hodarchaeota archaeon]